MSRSRCPGHARHWFSVYAGYDGGGPGIRSPTCVRCGAPNPRPLTADEQAEYDDLIAERLARKDR